jgi:ribosomal protein L11 methylase PrmA
VSLLCAVAVITALVSPIWAAAEHPRNVILIGWDGAQREHVDQCLGRGELPNLKKLIDEGKYIKIDVEGTTDTKAGWTQILTGYYPAVTGVYSNTRYQPVPKGLSIFERLENQFGPDNFVTVAVIAKDRHCGEIDPPQKIRLDDEQTQTNNAEGQTKKAAKKKTQQPGAGKAPTGKIVEENGVKYRVIPGSPYYGMHTALEVWEFGLMEDQKVGTRAIELLDKYKDKPFFFFVHFAEVDHSGHKYGENSKEYNDALISNDLWTGKIIEKIRSLGLADKTQFYVTADHGFDEDTKIHKFAPYVFLATNNKAVNRDGRRQDIAPTIYEAFGVDTAAMQPPLDGISLTKPDNRPPAKLGPTKAGQKTEAQVEPHAPDVVFVPTPQEVVEKMLETAQVTKDDVVYDLGCGDGRIVVTAAKKYGARAFGFDVDPQRIKESNENVQKNGVGNLVTIEQKDIFTLDLTKANVITLYLLPSLNVKLIPQLEKLKPGSRIVSHDFAMRGVKPDKVIEVNSENGADHTIYFWTAPLKKEQEEVEVPTRRPDVVFVPTPQPVVEKMLELAKVTKDDVVYDLGCGDGRIVVTAAKKFGCKAYGFDIDPRRIKESNENVQKNGVGDLVLIQQKDIFTLDLSQANVVTLYLLPSLNVKLIPQLDKLKPGSRIVSHDFDMRGVKPDQTVEVTTENGAEHTVYFWTTPLKKEPTDSEQ